jgi:formate/nitrite transporter FocA (FNT family)
MLMFMAVKTWQFTNGNPFYAMMPVGIFIVCGFNHCVADMFYLHMGCLHISDYLVLIPTTIGNLIGCNIIPWAINQSS